MSVFVIKRNDTLPYLDAVLSDDNGPIDLTNVTSVHFVMRSSARGVTDAKVRAECTVVGDPTNGEVRYEWALGDTDAAGTYRGEFEVNLGGRVLTYPSSTYIPISIVADLG